MRFHNKFRDYAQIIGFGLLAGTLSRLTDLLSMNTLWSFPSITVLYGFWIVTATFLIWRSTSHFTAGMNTFLYFLFMTAAYFGLEYLFGRLFAQFDPVDFQLQKFIRYCVAALIFGLSAIILYCWNHKAWYGSMLLAIPIGLLSAETIYALTLLQNQHTHLFQLIFNAGFCLYLGLQFRKLTKYKELYTVTVIGIAAAGMHFIYNL